MKNDWLTVFAGKINFAFLREGAHRYIKQRYQYYVDQLAHVLYSVLKLILQRMVTRHNLSRFIFISIVIPTEIKKRGVIFLQQNHKTYKNLRLQMDYAAFAKNRRCLHLGNILITTVFLGLFLNPSAAFPLIPICHGPKAANRFAVNSDSIEESVDTSSSNEVEIVTTEAMQSSVTSARLPDRKIELLFCDGDICRDSVRERVIGKHNQIILSEPATGQVAYRWNQKSLARNDEGDRSEYTVASILLLVRPNDDQLIKKVAEVVPKLTHLGIKVLLCPELAAKLKFNYDVDDDRISLFEPPSDANSGRQVRYVSDSEEEWVQDMVIEPFPDLVCTVGGDGSITHASMLFQGPVPPIMSIAGGSLGFLTAFEEDGMEDAICIALGIGKKDDVANGESPTEEHTISPPNMESYRYDPPHLRAANPKPSFGMGNYVCMTIRMRLDCRIVSPEGVVRCRYNVLNEVVIDRGSSPYLAALECFCDDVHLTTVQADGVIFAT
jgi:NAD kinase